MNLLRSQMADNGFAIVGAAGPADLVKLGMQQLLEALAATANPGMMKLNLQRLKFRKKGGHGRVLWGQMRLCKNPVLTRPWREAEALRIRNGRVTFHPASVPHF